MNNKKYSKNTLAKPNVYTPWLMQFTKPKGPTPKKLSDAQFYMQHPYFIKKFTAEFNRQVNDKDTPATLLLDLQNKVVKELFMQESEGVQESQRRENQDAHNELTAEYNVGLKGAPPVDQDGQDA